MNKINFKPAEGEDIETVFELLKEAAEWLRDKGIDYWQNWHDPPDAHVRWIKQGFEKHEFYLVERNREVIGCFRLQSEDAMFWGEKYDDAAYIHSFTTRRGLAGTGTGRRVLDLIETCCVSKGRQFLRLDCGASNLGLCKYYESLGFIPVGETTVGNERLTLYEKALANHGIQSILVPYRNKIQPQVN